MNLAIFDVDGTLLDNRACENACYAAALRDVLNLPTLDTEWDKYEHVSDAGIAVEAFRRRFGADPTSEQLSATITRFVALLEAACHANSSAITPIGGAAQILRAVAEQGWGVAIATGAWRRAAEFKLAVAGVDCTDVPLATSEDGPARAAIIANARSLAEQRHGVDRFFRLVSVGDATWDVRAARVLNIPFVGVGSGVRAERLHAAGARVVLEDFSDRARTFDALEQADVPG